jgi:hypothetical protein
MLIVCYFINNFQLFILVEFVDNKSQATCSIGLNVFLELRRAIGFNISNLHVSFLPQCRQYYCEVL